MARTDDERIKNALRYLGTGVRQLTMINNPEVYKIVARITEAIADLTSLTESEE